MLGLQSAPFFTKGLFGNHLCGSSLGSKGGNGEDKPKEKNRREEHCGDEKTEQALESISFPSCWNPAAHNISSSTLMVTHFVSFKSAELT